MLKQITKRLLAYPGYEIRRIPNHKEEVPGFRLYSYLKADGSFDYERYRQIQIEGNKRKIERVWAFEENIAFLSDYIKDAIGVPRFGICHGTRRGKEQEWFRKYLGSEVIGTEISETAGQFPHTIQWDFHEVKPEWLDSVDFIYSNSFDHSYDPAKCLNAWMSCVRRGGLCILEHPSYRHGPSDLQAELDPFGADIVLMSYLITKWAQGKYAVHELLETPRKYDKAKSSHFIVIRRL